MAVGGCYKCMKYTLVAFNFLVLCTGGVVLGLGIYVLVTDYGVDKLAPILGNNVFKAGDYLLIILGSITIAISFLGCVGACCENRCLLVFYFIIMLLLTLSFIVVVILGFVFKDRLKDEVTADLRNSILKDYGMKDKQTATDLWDNIQRNLECCGLAVGSKSSWAMYSDSEWFKTQPSNGYNDTGIKYVPLSCCKQTVSWQACQDGPPSLQNGTANQNLQNKDCYDQFYSFIDKYGAIIGGIAVAALAVMLLGTIFAICLCVAIGREKNYAV